MPSIFSPRRSSLTLQQQIEQFFSAQKSDELVLDITSVQNDLRDVANELRERLVTGHVRSIRIRVFDKVGHKKESQAHHQLLESIFSANSQSLTQVKVEGIEVAADRQVEAACRKNFFVRDIDIKSPAMRATFEQTTQRNREAQAYHRVRDTRAGLSGDSVLAGTMMGTVITTAGFVAGIVLTKLGLIPATVFAFTGAYPVASGVLGFLAICLTLLVPSYIAEAVFRLRNPSIKRPTIRSRNDMGLTHTAIGWGLPSAVILTFGSMGASFGVLKVLGISSATVLAVTNAHWIISTAALLGAVLLTTLGPLYLIEAVIRLRDYFNNRAFRKMRSRDFEFPESHEKNRITPTDLGPIAQMRMPNEGPLKTRSGKQNDLLNSQLLQLSKKAEINGPVTHTTQATYQALKRIVLAYEGNDALELPRLNDAAIAKPLLFKPSSLMRNRAFPWFVESHNPLRNSFNVTSAANHLDSDGRHRFESVDSKELSRRSEIVYLDNDVAVEHIKTNQVVSAEVFVDADSLKKIAIACNSNTSLSHLKFHFTNVVTEEQAVLIAQIILRNSPHLKSLDLREVTFPDVTKVGASVFNIIREALRLNGAITEFGYPKNYSRIKEIRHDIEEILTRNRAMQFRPEGTPLANPTLGMFLGSTVFGLGAVVIKLTFFATAATTLALALPLAITVAGAIIGLGIAALVFRHYEREARRESEKLIHLQAKQLADTATVDVSMTAEQYRSMKGQLTREEKSSAKLREEKYPKLAKCLDTQAKKASAANDVTATATAPDVKPRLVVKKAARKLFVGKEEKSHGDVLYMDPNTVITTKLSHARFFKFATECGVNTLAEQLTRAEVIGKDENAKTLRERVEHQQKTRKAETYDDYRYVKWAARKLRNPASAASAKMVAAK